MNTIESIRDYATQTYGLEDPITIEIYAMIEDGERLQALQQFIADAENMMAYMYGD